MRFQRHGKDALYDKLGKPEGGQQLSPLQLQVLIKVVGQRLLKPVSIDDLFVLEVVSRAPRAKVSNEKWTQTFLFFSL